MARPMATAWRWPPERLRTGSRSLRRWMSMSSVSRTVAAASRMARRSMRGRKAERAADRLPAGEDVFADAGGFGERQVLVDGLDAALAGVAGAGEGRPLALVPELAVVRLEDARDHLDEGGLAGPVVAGERQDLAAAQLEADLLERVDAAEALADL